MILVMSECLHGAAVYQSPEYMSDEGSQDDAHDIYALVEMSNG